MPTKKLRKKARTPRKDRLLRRFADTLGEDELAEVLIHAADPRAHRLMAMLLDPAFQRHSFGKLCERAGLNLVDLFDLLRRSKRSAVTWLSSFMGKTNPLDFRA